MALLSIYSIVGGIFMLVAIFWVVWYYMMHHVRTPYLDYFMKEYFEEDWHDFYRNSHGAIDTYIHREKPERIIGLMQDMKKTLKIYHTKRALRQFISLKDHHYNPKDEHTEYRNWIHQNIEFLEAYIHTKKYDKILTKKYII